MSGQQNNWWRVESGWIGFGERPYDDREIGLIWEIGRHEHRTVYLPDNRYRYEPNSAGVMRAVVSKGLGGQTWQQSVYIHESTDIEILRAWIHKKARNMARGYAKVADYHDGLKKSAADERARVAALGAAADVSA
ncbi:hypothetical protein [Bradyrhizobium diazoefficiens]|uniref:hypothetical protein n=1 Tax=Bradyrhizobium diazoefficiens TaxID=1355477 RepID=UPI0004B58DC0|nr:hypothetical protein [Bradyrhizobium diazoefficiens]